MADGSQQGTPRRLPRERPRLGSPHAQTLVTVGDRSAKVDEALAPLIEALWRLDISTRFSCQWTRRKLNLMTTPANFFYIMFPDPDDLRRMMELFVDTPLDPTRLRSEWRYELFPRFRSPGHTGAVDVGLHPMVFIPVQHLSEVTTVVTLACRKQTRRKAAGTTADAGKGR